MITAVDANILVDIFEPDPKFGELSRKAVRRCLAEGSLVACEVVWAEIAARFGAAGMGAQALTDLGVRFAPIDIEGAETAGAAWRQYRSEGGPRQRLIGDFLVGAHASLHADRLLTRDRGFHRRYFASLAVLDPTAAVTD